MFHETGGTRAVYRARGTLQTISMLATILGALYLFLPAYTANMAPVIARRLSLLRELAYPLDGGRTFRGQPLLGPNKTVRGIVVGVLAGIGTAFLQYGASSAGLLWPPFFFSHSLLLTLLWGLLLGSGALGGDLLKSILKRQLHIPPGVRWVPWDQLDMALGGLLLGSILHPFSLPEIVTILLLTPVFGLLINILGYTIRIKEEV